MASGGGVTDGSKTDRQTDRQGAQMHCERESGVLNIVDVRMLITLQRF